MQSCSAGLDPLAKVRSALAKEILVTYFLVGYEDLFVSIIATLLEKIIAVYMY